MGTEVFSVKVNHLPTVAEVHSRAFPESALTHLGPEAVRRYYEWQLTGPHEHQFIALGEGNRIEGFAVGGVSRAAIGGFVRRNTCFLAARVVASPSVVFYGRGPSALRTALKLLNPFGTRARPQPGHQANLRSFGILAVAVDPACQGKGVGFQLMEYLELLAQRHHFDRMHLTVSVSNTQAIRFYERLHWVKVSRSGSWTGSMEKSLC